MKRGIAKFRAITCALGAAAAVASAAPSVPAYADPATNQGTTRVTVRADNSNLMFRVPTLIPFSAAADGVLTGPSADATTIENLSVFPIHVVNMQVEKDIVWELTDNASASSAENSVDFQIGPEGSLIDAYAASQPDGTDLSRSSLYDMGYHGSGRDTIPLQTTGDVAKVSHDIYYEAYRVATIVWTLEAGSSVIPS